MGQRFRALVAPQRLAGQPADSGHGGEPAQLFAVNAEGDDVALALPDPQGGSRRISVIVVMELASLVGGGVVVVVVVKRQHTSWLSCSSRIGHSNCSLPLGALALGSGTSAAIDWRRWNRGGDYCCVSAVRGGGLVWTRAVPPNGEPSGQERGLLQLLHAHCARRTSVVNAGDLALLPANEPSGLA